MAVCREIDNRWERRCDRYSIPSGGCGADAVFEMSDVCLREQKEMSTSRAGKDVAMSIVKQGRPWKERQTESTVVSSNSEGP